MECITLRFAPRPPETFLRKAFQRTVGLIVPKSNPDFERRYVRVVEWWLEIDDDNYVSREIGFDSGRIPIVGAPLGVNWGVFIDDEKPLALPGELERSSLEPTLFEHAWAQLQSDWTDSWRKR